MTEYHPIMLILFIIINSGSVKTLLYIPLFVVEGGLRTTTTPFQRFHLKNGGLPEATYRLTGRARRVYHYSTLVRRISHETARPPAGIPAHGIRVRFHVAHHGGDAILGTGIWVETKAVHHHADLPGTIDRDIDTRRVIEKARADGDVHIDRWKELFAIAVTDRMMSSWMPGIISDKYSY